MGRGGRSEVEDPCEQVGQASFPISGTKPEQQLSVIVFWSPFLVLFIVIGLRPQQFFIFYFIFLWLWVFSLHVCLGIMCMPVPTEARRGHQVSWDWRYRWFLAVLGNEPGSSGRPTGAFNCWAISPSQLIFILDTEQTPPPGLWTSQFSWLTSFKSLLH